MTAKWAFNTPELQPLRFCRTLTIAMDDRASNQATDPPRLGGLLARLVVLIALAGSMLAVVLKIGILVARA